MAITCTTCGYDNNPDGSEFCDACGAELLATSASPTQIQTPTVEPVDNIDNNVSPPPLPQPSIPPPSTTPIPPPTIATAATARLIAKQSGVSTPEFPLDGSNAIIGIFDPDTGPVDIDLEEFSGNETVSRNHAEIYQEAGMWKIKDLGSTNGVFVKHSGETRFSARITMPKVINPGDEIAIAKVRFLFQSP